MNIWRIAGVALMVGLALFLFSVVVKLLLIAAVTALIIKVVGKQIARRYYGSLNRDQWQSTSIISIDNSDYRSPMNRATYDRVISIG